MKNTNKNNNKKYKGVYFTDKDVQLIKYLHFYRGALFEQIKRDIYNKPADTTIYSRLQKLKDYQYIQSKYTRHNGQKKAFGITQKAFNEFVDPLKDAKLVELSSKSIDHDVDLVDIAFYLRKLNNIKQYLSENILHTWSNYKDDKSLLPIIENRSDAAIKVEINEKLFWVALEYESSLKSTARYRQIINDIHSQVSLPLVLYVTKDETIRNSLISIEKKYFNDKKPKLFYNCLNNLKQNKNIVFTNRYEQSLNFK